MALPDREKVIHALEQCTDTTGHRVDCYGCYQEGPGFGFVCRENLMRDALALLREQEPVRPKRENAGHRIIMLCGACGAQIPTPGGWRYKYCPTCGRRIKWDYA